MTFYTPLVNLNVKDQNKPVYPERSDQKFQGLRGEHLQIEGDCVYWIKNGLTFRTLTYRNEQVLAAEFTHFKGYDGQAMVVFVADMAHVYFENGKVYTVHMPFSVTRAMPCDRGLVLERDLSMEDSKLPKFYTLTDPILEIGLVAPSSTSAITPGEELMYFEGTICITLVGGQARLYQARFLARTSKATMRRHSRRKSSMLPKSSDNESDSPLDQRLSFSRTETGALDRMGDFTDEDSSQFDLDANNMRKDIILTHIGSISVGNNIRIRGLSYQDREALAIVNQQKSQGYIVLVAKPSGPTDIYSVETMTEISAEDVGVVTREDGHGFFMMMSRGTSMLINPFYEAESPPLALPKEWGPKLEVKSCSGNVVVLKSQTGRLHQFSIMLDPQEEFVKHCISSFEQILGTETNEKLRFLWVAALYYVPHDGWGALVVALLAILAPSIGAPEELHEYATVAQRFGQEYELDDKGNMLWCLHILREDSKMDFALGHYTEKLRVLVGWLLSISTWDGVWSSYYDYEHGEPQLFCGDALTEYAPNIYECFIGYFQDDVESKAADFVLVNSTYAIAPRIEKMLVIYTAIAENEALQILQQLDITVADLNRYPEAIRVPILEYISQAFDEEPDELRMYQLLDPEARPQALKPPVQVKDNPRDIRSIASKANIGDASLDVPQESDRVAVSRLIFAEDRRFYEVTKLLQTSRQPTAMFRPSAEWSDHELLAAQHELYKVVAERSMSIPFGRAALFYASKQPLATEKYHIPRMNLNMLIKPGNTTMSMPRGLVSDEILQWGQFHQGVASGLITTRNSDISGSWIIFNKPQQQMSSQHAGFLLGLGLNGNLKSLEEWHIYNYLGPKHQQTSIALLVGMAASSMSSMDNKLTKVLSVHVAALLPVGSNYLNVSIPVQTAGVIGVALLYYNTQHRRMSELMLNEIGTPEVGERNEAYRLAAGMALGLINLGKGNDLRGLNDMHIVERLLEIAVVARDVEAAKLDTTVPGAIVALMFIFLKTGNEAVIKKLEIPDSEQLLDYIRPDFLFLRVLARNMIVWDNVGKSPEWVESALTCFSYDLRQITSLTSDQMGYYNVIGGMCLSMGLRYASTADPTVKSTLIHYLDAFSRLMDLPLTHFDSAVARKAVSNVHGSIGMALGAVMAGTGDVEPFRRFRRSYGRTRRDIRFGDYMANEMAMGLLFLGGGQWALNRSKFGIASLVMAFYPILPTTTRDNEAHLQALRYFWIFAAEPRCLTAREETSKRPCNVDVTIEMVSGEQIYKTTPCLLPQLDQIEYVTTTSPQYYEVTFTEFDSLDFYVRERPKSQTFENMLEVAPASEEPHGHVQSALAPLRDLNEQEVDSVLKSTSLNPTKTDIKLALQAMATNPGSIDDLWNLKLLFAFSDSCENGLKYLTELEIDQLKIDLWQNRPQ